MISFNTVSKRRGARHILTDVSFEALPGRVTGFLGPNGAGKSSSLRILLGLDRATAGQAQVAGRSYASLDHPLTHVGALLDGAGAHRSRTARQHLRWVAISNGIGRRRIDEVLDLVHLSEDAHRRVGTYSLGMGQRLGLATALLGDPGALVLDEPVNGLDPEGVRWIRTLLRTLAAEGRTVLLSSHLMAELEGTADDIVVIDRGRIVANDTLARFQGRHATLEDAFFATLDQAAASPQHTGVTR